jgi:hypothetical protein
MHSLNAISVDYSATEAVRTIIMTTNKRRKKASYYCGKIIAALISTLSTSIEIIRTKLTDVFTFSCDR